MKQGCPLSPTLFGLYIDELEDFLMKSSQPGDGCYLHQVLISILLFADDVALLALLLIAYRDSLMVLLLSVLNNSLWSIYLRHGLWSLTI